MISGKPAFSSQSTETAESILPGIEIELVNSLRYVANNPVNDIDPSGLGKAKAIGWVVRRVGGKLVRVEVILTEQQAAKLFAGKCAREGLDVLVTGGRQAALKVGNIIQNNLGGPKATGEILKGGTHLGHQIRNLLGEVIGTGTRHIQFDKIPNRHIFYGGLATLLLSSGADAAIDSDFSVSVTETYTNPYPGPSIANACTFSYWCGEDSWLALADWVNPGELLAMGGDVGREISRQIEKELIGYVVTIRDKNGVPALSISFDADGTVLSIALWQDGEIIETYSEEEFFGSSK
ncbi:hypothetical protein SH668x_000098 [Planctomicrobium sp. SH668]|uniref:hypothetical protein n=1 Tax=Planctomicrobium sp. SH668 TaxID=3448126 RepID=UPI003F5CA5EB